MLTQLIENALRAWRTSCRRCPTASPTPSSACWPSAATRAGVGRGAAGGVGANRQGAGRGFL